MKLFVKFTSSQKGAVLARAVSKHTNWGGAVRMIHGMLIGSGPVFRVPLWCAPGHTPPPWIYGWFRNWITQIAEGVIVMVMPNGWDYSGRGGASPHLGLCIFNSSVSAHWSCLEVSRSLCERWFHFNCSIICVYQLEVWRLFAVASRSPSERCEECREWPTEECWKYVE